jgi:beta-glucosidase
MKLKQILSITLMLLIFLSGRDKAATPANGDNLSVEEKVNALLSKMTLDEKIGQMIQADFMAIKDLNDIKNYHMGSVLGGGDSEIDDLTPKGWADFYDKTQSVAMQDRLKIPLVFGIDAVHGHNNVLGAVLFPHNIALGCTRNPELVKKAAEVTAKEVLGTGMNWTFAPCIAVARNERWGRTYESFGETPELAEMLGAAAVEGFQGKDLAGKESVLACAKHYVGDGGTTNGQDQGNTEIDEKTLREIHLPGYIATIKSGVGSVMASYNSWNGNKVHGVKYLLTDVLKNELKFDGFIISDYAAVDQVNPDYKKAVEQSINAGMDMVMIPFEYKKFFNVMKELVSEGKIPQSRIDDAVRRILRIKFRMNLFEKPYLTDRTLTAQVGSAEHREVARECVRESMVLLKNDGNLLPIPKSVKRIHMAGKGANDMGIQCGGWTISWQGKPGDVTPGGTTIEKGIENTVSKSTKVTYSADGTGAEGADVGIVVIGETPYAEGKGDRTDLSLSPEDAAAVNNMKAAGIPVVVILLSGRPMIINDVLDKSDAFVAAWLPGTEGQGVADVLFGDFNFKGKLSASWPRSMQQIPINFGDSNYDPLFPYNFGLTY